MRDGSTAEPSRLVERPRQSLEERQSVAEHDRMDEEPELVDETELDKAVREARAPVREDVPPWLLV